METVEPIPLNVAVLDLTGAQRTQRSPTGFKELGDRSEAPTEGPPCALTQAGWLFG